MTQPTTTRSGGCSGLHKQFYQQSQRSANQPSFTMSRNHPEKSVGKVIAVRQPYQENSNPVGS
jgi:hypothetical protein